MSERYTEEWVASLLDGAERFGRSDPAEMLRELGVGAGSTVVDYGCGPGLFTLAAARLVGTAGKVYGVDLEPRMVELVARRAQEAGLSNVTAVASDGTRAALPDAVADSSSACRSCTTSPRGSSGWRWPATSLGCCGPAGA